MTGSDTPTDAVHSGLRSVKYQTYLDCRSVVARQHCVDGCPNRERLPRVDEFDTRSARRLVRATDALGASASSAVLTVPAKTMLIPTGASWRCDDTGANLGTAWRALAFNDSAWTSGPAAIGFGAGDRDESHFTRDLEGYDQLRRAVQQSMARHPAGNGERRAVLPTASALIRRR